MVYIVIKRVPLGEINGKDVYDHEIEAVFTEKRLAQSYIDEITRDTESMNTGRVMSLAMLIMCGASVSGLNFKADYSIEGDFDVSDETYFKEWNIPVREK